MTGFTDKWTIRDFAEDLRAESILYRQYLRDSPGDVYV